MTLYGSALFIHVVFAILLVGGSAYAHVSLGLLPRVRSVDGARSHAMWLHVLVKATGPFAAVVLASGLYLTFAGSWWGAGWPVVSLVLFALAGTAATTVIDPRVGRLRAAIDAFPDGPMPPGSAASLIDPTLRLAAWVLFGTDMAIVFLMTNKPGWAGATLTGAVGIAAGVTAGTVANRRSVTRQPQMPPPVAPAA